MVLSFRGGSSGAKAGILIGGLAALWLLSRTGPVDRALTRAIGWLLTRRGFGVRDCGTLLDLRDDYAVVELTVRAEDWIAGQTLRQLRLRDEGIVVIGVQRQGSYNGAPGPDENGTTRGHARGLRHGGPDRRAGPSPARSLRR